MKTIYYNGNIITMEENGQQQAILIEDGIIQKTGSSEALLATEKSAERVDLDGRTMLPAFIDSHGHLSSYAMTRLQARLQDTASTEELLERLHEFAVRKQLQPGQWLRGNGYDHNQLEGGNHPDTELLDREFPNNPVVLSHASGHSGVFNFAARKLIGLSGSGYLFEQDFTEAMKKVPVPGPDELLPAYKEALDCYAAYGITTLQEGMMVKEMIPIYRRLLEKNLLNLNVVGYPQSTENMLFMKEFPESKESYYRNFRLGGCKIILDGSPQQKTAWMKASYYGEEQNFGMSVMKDEEVMSALLESISEGRQLLAHCNGDAAAEQYLRCAEEAVKNVQTKEEQERRCRFAATRPVLIHAQLLARDQLTKVKALHIIPSFFVAHCYYWGDIHIRNFGLERASRCSPVKSAEKEEILFTLHQDAPVIEPDMLRTIWCAVNRITRTGVVLGEEERISVHSALRAVTRSAAYQYGEEKEKGSLQTGKKADFVLLDRNPYETAPEKLLDIAVLETYRNGECIYKK